MDRAAIHSPCIHTALALFSPKAWSTQFKICSKVCSHAEISETGKISHYFLVLEKKRRSPQSTEINNLHCSLRGLVPAQWGGPPPMPSQPLDCLLSHNELGGGISAALRYVVRKVLSEMAAANQEQAGMGCNGKENRLKINIKYAIIKHKQPSLLL